LAGSLYGASDPRGNPANSYAEVKPRMNFFNTPLISAKIMSRAN
jgi:hypothetical protein